MLTLVAGTGYTGRRVLDLLPVEKSLGLSRSAIETKRRFALVDFDTLDTLPADLPDDYSVLYTCPPDGAVDELSLIHISEPTRPSP